MVADDFFDALELQLEILVMQWLYDEIVSVDFITFDGEILHVGDKDDDDGLIEIPDFPTDGNPVCSRKLDIHEDQIISAFVIEKQGLCGASPFDDGLFRSGSCFLIIPFDMSLKQLIVAVVILYDKYVHNFLQKSQ